MASRTHSERSLIRLAPHGFTLIELLVVIAIIGILSSVVLASLNIARERGKEASIRSTLKSMASEIELLRDSNPDYNFVNNCQNAGHALEKYVTALAAQGATVRCDSFSLAPDVYARWGVTASVTGASKYTVFSASTEGVVKWDGTDANGGAVTSATNASTVCTNLSKRLPTIEQLRALWKITSTNPAAGFVGSSYWSGTEVPGVSANAYSTSMGLGYVDSDPKTYSRYARCVN